MGNYRARFKLLAGRAFLLLLNLYSLGMIAFLGLRALTGDRYWPLALLANFTPWLLLPGFGVLAVMLWRQRRIGAGLAGLVTLAFGWLYGGLLLPAMPTACAGDCRTLRVMTYNAGAGHTTPEALVRLIGESDADIVGLQEIGDFHVAAIERELGAEYSYRVLYGYGLAAGIGLMSRYPILHHEQFSGTYDFLPFLRVVIDYHGQPITIIVVHPPMPLLDRAGYHIRSDYDFAVFSQMAQDGQPTLLIGDLNTTDRSDQYRRLKAAGLDDAFREMGIGFGHTWPTTGRYPPIPLPLIRIDYIWYNAHFRVARAWVGPDSGSDHLPVLADLVWATGGR